ncbi:MAG: restriction system-associated family ATPase [Bacteroidota bacterium]|jgi:restriction system-associated AAA family ATPase|nr:restriction system-associated family ATPase [Bacteroidota bacterium]
MKLVNVKILGDDFRSLSANKLYKFNLSFHNDRLSTKVFAGLNGSGKSNFLELFSEIFYFLEITHLSTVSEAEKANKNFGFEIEYLLPKTEKDIYDLFVNDYNEVREKYISSNSPLTKFNKLKFEDLYINEIENIIQNEWDQDCNQLLLNNYIHVRVSKQLGFEPEFSLKRQNENDSYKAISLNTKRLLPSKLIAYTSGQNELLSNPFFKLKYHYFKEFEKKELPDLADNHRLFFLDYSTNFSIFIANMLLADGKKLAYLKEVLKINELQAFRITINTDEIYKRVIPLDDRLASNLQQLKLCATTWTEKKVDKYNLLILDFLVNDATKASFKYHFENAFNLFKVFYELEIFNLYLVNKKTRDLMLQVHKSYNFSDEMSKPDPSRLVFRIEKIFISKKIDVSKAPKNIYYKALSDGEHQFNEVIGTILMMEQEGCLFLIDEPDTHFNPKWRAKLIQMLNYMAAETFDGHGNIEKVRKQEIIITTHSPFVISDCITEDVYRFTKTNGIIEYDNPTVKMYGASISVILEEIFEKEESISEMAKKELKDMIDGVKTLDQLRAVIDKLNSKFGDSVQKFDLFSKLRTIKEEIENKEK